MRLVQQVLLFGSAWAFSYKTHKFLGNLLEKSGATFIDSLRTDIVDFSNASVWADKIKKYKDWSKPLHYIDITCEQLQTNKIPLKTIEKACNNKCAFTAILNMTNEIKYNCNRQNVKNENLLFIMHFLQDLIQPMHVFGTKRGGNDMPLTIFINNTSKRTNLHYLWDSIIPEHFTKTHNYTIPNVDIITIGSIYDFKDILLNTVYKIHNIACTVIPSSNQIVFEDYYKASIVKKMFDVYFDIAFNTFNYIYQYPICVFE
jgi:hypothetical protein